ncbi:MAG: hypothetical protein ACTSRK_14475 [Promethearchaeota archaeon]
MKNSKNVIIALFLLFWIFGTMPISQVKGSEGYVYSPEITIPSSSFLSFSTEINSGRTIEGVFETSEPDYNLDFFIVDSANYQLREEGEGYIKHHEMDEIHIGEIYFEVTQTDTYYFIFHNDALFKDVIVDILIDPNNYQIPEFSTEIIGEGITIEEGEYYGAPINLEDGETLSGSYESYFGTDELAFLICDTVNYANLGVEGAAVISEYSLSESSSNSIEFEADQDQTYYVVFDAREQTDPVTFSYGFDIEDPPLIDIDSDDDDISITAKIPGYSGIIIFSLLSIVWITKKRRKS